ncbi:MAG: hypothetical protein JST29_05500 [Bacteroidetes bacterium]|nr:hypothetical protein [Bacteroidota bacterium]
MENKKTLIVVFIVAVIIALYFLLRKKKPTITIVSNSGKAKDNALPPSVTVPVKPVEVGSIANTTPTHTESPVTAPQLPPQVTLPFIPVVAQVGSIADETPQDAVLPVQPEIGYIKSGLVTDEESLVTAPQLPPQVTLPFVPVVAQVGAVEDAPPKEVYKTLQRIPFYENDFFLTQNIAE